MITFPKYEAYQDSDIEWVGKIPDSWNTLPIRSIFQERKEKNTGEKTDFILSVMKDRGIIPYDEKGNVGNKKSENIENYKVVYPGDLVVNKMNAMIGSLGISPYYGALSQVYFVLYPRNPSRTDQNYFGYVFKVKPFQKSLIKIAKGIMELRESIEFDEFKNLHLPFPPIDEQRKIAEFLDRKTAEIDEAIAHKQRLIELLQEQKAILINQAVTKGLNPNAPMRDSGVPWLRMVPERWKVCSVKRLTKILRGKFSHRPRNDPRFYDGKHPFIQTGDIARSGRKITQYSQTLNEAGYAISKEFPAGTVAMVITGAKTGEVSILGFNACFPDSAVGFFPNQGKVSSDFLFYMFQILKSGLDEVAIVSTQENLNVDRIGTLYTVFPPIGEQHEIVDFLDTYLIEFETAQSEANKQIDKLQEYRQILISQTVTGKIKV